MPDIKISIVIPVYNVENYLSECLESVLGQTLEGIEVIAVNDGSTDKSMQILQEYEKNYREILHVYHIENQGVSYARNFGVSKAIGNIFFLWTAMILLSRICVNSI